MKVCPAIVSVQLRVVQSGFALTLTVTERLPLPLAGDTVTQLVHGLLTVHEHPLAVETLTLVLPPPAGADQLVGEIE